MQSPRDIHPLLPFGSLCLTALLVLEGCKTKKPIQPQQDLTTGPAFQKADPAVDKDQTPTPSAGSESETLSCMLRS